MKEIKFRAWDKKMSDPFEMSAPFNPFFYGGVFTANCVFMQFTGVTDKNGKEIYTGDILQLKRLDGSVLLYKIFCVKGGFAFNTHQDDFYKPQSEIYFYESTSDMQNSSFICTLEIIGNVFENADLVKL